MAQQEPDIRPCFDGEQWTPEALGAWLAGLFDRAGHIHLRTRKPVTLRVHDTQVTTLALIQQRLKCGDVQMEERTASRPLYTWRITEADQVWRVLTTMLPYLTTSREAAYQAMDRIQAQMERVKHEHRLDSEVAARKIAGHSVTSIASDLRITSAEVQEALARHERGPDMPDAEISTARPRR